MLIGRQRECERLTDLLERAKLGRSAALVVRGEAGIGKTALLEWAAEQASGFTVARTLGIESEAELEFSGLLDVSRPLLEHLRDLPSPQADALRGVLGLGPPQAADPFAIGAATLGLVAAAADADPLLVVVDDAQWVDRASAAALRFAARRLDADRACLLFGVRDDEPGGAEWSGFQELRVPGLELDAARVLLGDASAGSATDAVVERVWEATGGNPLAIRELGSLLEPAQLEGSAPLAEPLPAGDTIKRAFSRRTRELSPETQKALGVAATATSTDLAPIAAALAHVGLDVSALVAAEDAGLLELATDAVRFRHPLVRAAVYDDRPASERREAHRALAAAYEELGDLDLGARHLAAGTVGHDPFVAEAVAAAGERARARTAHAAASEAFVLAARLVPPGPARTAHLASAAEAAWQAGAFDRALALSASALEACVDPTLRAELLMLRARVELTAGTHERARELCVEAADLFAPLDAARAVGAIDLAAWAAHFEGDDARALELARRVRKLSLEAGSRAELHAEYILGRSLVRAGERADGEPLLARAVEGLLAGPDPPRINLVWAATSLALLERLEESVVLVDRIVSLARSDGPAALVYGLGQAGHLRGRSDDWDRAVADAAEAVALTRALGLPNMQADGLASLVRLEARRGQEESCRAHVAEAAPVFEAAGMTTAGLHLRCNLGLLELALGRLEEAAATLAPAADEIARRRLLDRDLTPVPDLVETLARLGRHEEAQRRLEAWAADDTALASPWAQPLERRCHGLLAPDDAIDEPFDTALRLHGVHDEDFARARTLLCFGERLRRAGRRREARARLTEADAVFERLGATPWSDRARRELRASGQTLRRREHSDDEQLTPQELQIALQVAEGKTNKEVGAALFLSHKTVEFHLSRVYRKLDLSSRAELIRRFSVEAVLEPTA